MARYRKVSETEWIDTSKGGVVSAKKVMYDNTESGMEATNAQDAIDEVRQDLTQFEKSANSKLDRLDRALILNNTANYNSIALTQNRTYLIFGKVFSTVENAGFVGIVMGGFNIHTIYKSSDISISRNGTTYTITSSLGNVYIGAIASYV